MSFVKDAVNTVTGGLLGESGGSSSGYAQMSQDEIDRLRDIENQLKKQYSKVGNENADFNNMFKQLLTNFVKGSDTPEELARASSFVDQTFTNPARAQINQNLSDFSAQADARAAALGRNPYTDIATQQAMLGETQRQNLALNTQRGQMIADNRTNQLNAGMLGGQFLNNLTQQAFANRMSLLNARSGIADYYQKQRMQSQSSNGSAGLLGNLASLGTQTAGAIGGIGAGVNAIGGMFGKKPT
jgi:hypothetical protein